MKSLKIAALVLISGFSIHTVNAEQTIQQKQAEVKEFKACGNQYKDGNEIPTKQIECKQNWPESFPG